MENAPMHRPMRQASRQVRNVDQLHAIVEACHTYASAHSMKRACSSYP